MVAACQGADVYYERTGSGKKRVLLLHGWGCSSELMRPVAQALVQDAEVMLLDFPGFGKSGRPPEPWGIPEYAECIRTLLEQEDFLPCTVIAHSFGARVAVFLASRNHSLFDRLVLTGAAGIRKPQTEEGRRRQEEFRKAKIWIQRMRKVKVFGTLPDRLEQMAREKYGSRDYNALDDEMRKTFVKVISLDQTDALHNITAPVLLIWGDQDTETPLWMGKKMEEMIPDAGLVIFEGGTHFAYLEQNARFNTIVHHFIAEE